MNHNIVGQAPVLINITSNAFHLLLSEAKTVFILEKNL